ncbi:MAG: tagatose 1,6-diphosphate aldolase, partial [Bacteroidota bacterium]
SHATAVLLDPEYSAAQAIAHNALPKDSGLVVALESTGFTGEATARRAQIIPGWSVEKAKRMGASAVKLLVYYHPDAFTAGAIEDLVKRVADQCEKLDILLMLEPLSYSIHETRTLTAEEREEVVVRTAERLTPLGIDLLKAESPVDANDADASGWERAMAQVSDVSLVPWILLSAAADYEVFLRQLGAACNSGASGVAVGRAVWKEAIMLTGEPRMEFLRTTALQRMWRLAALCDALARPYTDFYQCTVPMNWLESY